jgi:hypothetical protein
MIGRISILCAAAVALCAQQQFDSPEAAAQALIGATGAHDSAKLMAIFGPRGHSVLTCGNPEQDRSEQTEFSSLAATKHQIETDARDRNRAILLIGDEDWPFPVPLVRVKGKWSFDASQAQVEMEARRIGTEELDAIEICQGYVEAQRRYASRSHDRDGMLTYASQIMSTPGGQNGLYSEAAPMVPKGLAEAARPGSTTPYHGYYFRILDGQGPHAPGGAHNYVAGKRLIGGFALVAWPAHYGVTGIHTFMVNQDGVVWEKDIAPVPGKPGPQVDKYDPDDSWKRVD